MIFHSSIEPIYFILPFIGLLVGLFGSMLGGGGGYFFLPVLTLLIRVPVQTAVITSLVATLPVCLVGSLGHYRKSNIDLQLASLFSLTGITGAFLGAGITSLVSSRLLKVGFGVYSLFIAANMAYTNRKNRNSPDVENTAPLSAGLKRAKGSVFGFFAGIITGAFGTSGTAPVLAGLFSMGIPLKIVIGTSMLVVLINSVFAVGAHFLVGKIDLTLVGFLTVGSAIGALAGPWLLSGIKAEGNAEGRLKYIYAAVLGILGIVMIFA